MATTRKQPARDEAPASIRGDLVAPDYLIKIGPFALGAMGEAWTVDLMGRWTDFEARLTERKPITDAELDVMFTEAFGPTVEADVLSKVPLLMQLKAMRGFFQKWQQDLAVTVEDVLPGQITRVG